VIGAVWQEINWQEKVWTIPGTRMKAGKEHRVPLCGRALAVLQDLKPSEDANDNAKHTVFPGAKASQPLSNMALLKLLRRMKRDDLTTHGFRSTFRDWAAERTGFPNEVVEMALAHALGSKVEAAYRRGDLFDKRRRLMDAWSQFCATAPAKKDNVASLRSA
jgi:integrase